MMSTYHRIVTDFPLTPLKSFLHLLNSAESKIWGWGFSKFKRNSKHNTCWNNKDINRSSHTQTHKIYIISSLLARKRSKWLQTPEPPAARHLCTTMLRNQWMGFQFKSFKSMDSLVYVSKFMDSLVYVNCWAKLHFSWLVSQPSIILGDPLGDQIN